MKTTILTNYLLRIVFLMGSLFCYSCENSELTATKDQPSPQSGASSRNALATGQKVHTFSSAAGDERSYYISVPTDYSGTKKYRLVFVFAGTDTTGQEMYTWLGQGWNSNTPGLEKLMDDTIFVYPDQKYNWGNVKGWALGNYADPYDGWHDIQFTKELLALIKNTYSIDGDLIFATGHSWGGDMTNVTAYFLKGIFKAVAPIASNEPFWFRNSAGSYVNEPGYTGNTAVWIFFGLDDDHFGNSSVDGDFGIQQADFWILKNGADPDQYTTASIGGQGDETKTYSGTSPVKLTLYESGQYSGGGTLLGHQPPDYYFQAVSDWFMAF